MSSELGVAVIGAGYWGKNVVRNFAQSKGARLVSVADLVEGNRRRAAAAHPEARITERYEDVLADAEVGAVAVCTGAAQHHEVALAALRAGKHVFVEKPLALRADHAAELVREADALGRTLMVGHLMVHHPAIRWIHDRLQAGEWGTPYYLYFQRLNLGVIRQDESAWWSLAPHDISMAIYLLGEQPVSVSARGASYLRPGNEDVVFATLQFRGGQLAEIHTSWLDPHKARRLTLVGSKRMVTFDDIEPQEKVRVYDRGADRTVHYDTYAEMITLRQGDIWIPALSGREPLGIECQHFVDCIRDGRSPETPGTQGLDVVRALVAGQESMARGGAAVTLDEVR